jgi:hypothetical protein
MTTENPSSPTVARMSLRKIGVRPGTALQTRRLVEGAVKKEAQFFGAIEGKGVMVGPMGSEGSRTDLEVGEVVVVRGFTGQHEFSFISKVLQTFEKPFAYALLAYPNEVDATQVRQSMRTKVSWPTVVQLPANPGETQPSGLEATLLDISMHGAMVKAESPLAAIGQLVTLRLDVRFEDTPTQLAVAASICHNNRAPDGSGYFIGVAFKNLTQHNKLVLHYMTTAAPSQP